MLAPLSRFIEANSNGSNMVLEAFAGCATTCIPAELVLR